MILTWMECWLYKVTQDWPSDPPQFLCTTEYKLLTVTLPLGGVQEYENGRENGEKERRVECARGARGSNLGPTVCWVRAPSSTLKKLFKQASLPMAIDRLGWLRNTTAAQFGDFVRYLFVRVKKNFNPTSRPLYVKEKKSSFFVFYWDGSSYSCESTFHWYWLIDWFLKMQCLLVPGKLFLQNSLALIDQYFWPINTWQPVHTTIDIISEDAKRSPLWL